MSHDNVLLNDCHVCCSVFQSKGNISEAVDKRIKTSRVAYKRNRFTSTTYLEATGLEKRSLRCSITSGTDEYCEDELTIEFKGKCVSQVINECV